MSRPLSTPAKQSLFAAETSVVWLILLTIDHPSLAQPIRVVNNNCDITSRGDVYQAFPFQISLPAETENSPPQVTLTIDNVDRSIVQAVRQIQSPPSVTLEVITDVDLDQVEVGPFAFTLKEVRYDSLTVEGQLSFEPVLDEGYPSGRFTPADFPGLF